MRTDTFILTGDIGGTHARFSFLEKKPKGGWNAHHFSKVKCSNFLTFELALQSYLEDINIRPHRAAFCAAGPIEDGYVNLTNNDWQISANNIRESYGLERCSLYNDFTGMTRSIPELGDEGLKLIRHGKKYEKEPILVAGPGTGFGAGYLIPTTDGWKVIATESGHMRYSPQTRLEFELYQILSRQHDFVSLELVSSGMGLPLIHKAVCEIHKKPYIHLEPHQIRSQAKEGVKLARDICNIRAAATMGAIGDLALSGGARGGIVLAGGVSEYMIDFFMEPVALDRYLCRGLRSDYVHNIPIQLINNPLAPLIGSAAMLED